MTPRRMSSRLRDTELHDPFARPGVTLALDDGPERALEQAAADADGREMERASSVGLPRPLTVA